MWKIQNQNIKTCKYFYKLPYIKKKKIDLSKIRTIEERKPIPGSSSHEMGGARMEQQSETV